MVRVKSEEVIDIFFHGKDQKKILKAVLIGVAVLFAVALLLGSIALIRRASSERDLYTEAVNDARDADKNEIKPLVTLTKDSDMVTWNGDGTKVLLLSWHKHPERYIAGESFACTHGEIWTFTDKEMLSWYDLNAESVVDWELRLEQLIGLPESAEYTHVSAFWVELDELVRPSYQTDVTGQMSEDLLDGSALGDLRGWFDGNVEYSYSDETPYPWTRLGYTYDWADNGEEYGLSEFLILPDSVIEVEWTLPTDEFIAWLGAN